MLTSHNAFYSFPEPYPGTIRGTGQLSNNEPNKRKESVYEARVKGSKALSRWRMGTPRSVSGSGKSSSAVTLPAWVNSIVVNAYLDSRRRVTRHPTVSLEGLTEDMDDSSFSFLDSKEKSPLALLTEQEQRDILWRAIDRMPELQVEMLLRFYLEDHSYQEISEVMQMPLGTVKSRLNRARLALSRKLKAHEKVFIT